MPRTACCHPRGWISARRPGVPPRVLAVLSMLVGICCVAAPAAAQSRSPASPATASRPAPATEAAKPVSVTIPAVFNKPAPESLDDLRAMEQHVQKLSPRLQACTVGVSIGRAQGSGVVVTPDGYVLTAAHVIGRPGRACTVIFPDGSRKQAETLGTDSMVDAGLIRITDPAPSGGWPHAPMAPALSVEPGNWCLATGHPGGLIDDRPPVVRLGRVIFSSKRVLQSDCELVGGDSGGPLFDVRGRVIAINSRIQDETSANFHVPVDAYHAEWERLVAGEAFRSHSGALLGVSGKPVEDGIEVTRVFPGEPAEAGGLLVGDVIVTLESRKVSTLAALTELVGQKAPGSQVRIEVLRDGKPMTLRVRLGMRWD